MRQKVHKLHREMIEIAEIIEEKALLDVVAFARLKLACQDNDELTITGDDWERVPQNIKLAIHHALNDHPSSKRSV